MRQRRSAAAGRPASRGSRARDFTHGSSTQWARPQPGQPAARRRRGHPTTVGPAAIGAAGTVRRGARRGSPAAAAAADLPARGRARCTHPRSTPSRRHAHAPLAPQASRTRSVAVRAAANRPTWYPGAAPPKHLNGSLPGDYGFGEARGSQTTRLHQLSNRSRPAAAQRPTHMLVSACAWEPLGPPCAWAPN